MAAKTDRPTRTLYFLADYSRRRVEKFPFYSLVWFDNTLKGGATFSIDLDLRVGSWRQFSYSKRTTHRTLLSCRKQTLIKLPFLEIERSIIPDFCGIHFVTI